MPKPRCIIYKMEPPLDDAALREMAKTIPWANNCLTCERRAQGKLTRECYKDI